MDANNQLKKESILSIYNSKNELSNIEQTLIDAAKSASLNAYAPYSDFYVGCALLLENGEIISAANQENAAFPSGLCAERSAFFYASSKFPDVKITMAAVYAKPKNGSLQSPAYMCGACVQSLSEHEHRFKNDIRFLLFSDDSKIYVAESTRTFLPFQFEFTK